jgi:hypothetical protein
MQAPGKLALIVVVLGGLLVPWGASAAGPIVQSGSKNYVGPSCPGDDWNCAEGNHAVQTGDENVFECPDLDTASSATQECTVEQTGEDNLVILDLTIAQTSTSGANQSQSATQNVAIKQTSVNGPNSVEGQTSITQAASTTNRDDIRQKQNATSNIIIEQDSETGDNSITLAQSFDQDASATGNKDVWQGQNAAATAPNLFFQADQATDEGEVTADVDQTSGQNAAATASKDIDQFQSTTEGGIDGYILQHSDVGPLTADLDQSEVQHLSADQGGDLRQVQHGPVLGDLEVLSAPNTGNITQSVEHRSDPGAVQTNLMVCDNGFDQGDCTQTYDNNGEVTQNSCEAPCSATIGCEDVTCTTETGEPDPVASDVAITKTDGEEIVTPVTTHAYTIEVSASGGDAEGVTIFDDWPEQFVRGTTISTSQGSCADTGEGSDFTCSLGTILGGATVTITVGYSVPVAVELGEATNTVTITSEHFGDPTSNNTASDTNTVVLGGPS